MFSKLRNLVTVALIAGVALILSAGTASATDTGISLPSLGFDMALTIGNFVTGAGGMIGIGVGFLFAVVVIGVAIRWIMRGSKK